MSSMVDPAKNSIPAPAVMLVIKFNTAQNLPTFPATFIPSVQFQ